MKKESEGKVDFAVGTGRCGTKFLSVVIGMEPGVSSIDTE